MYFDFANTLQAVQNDLANGVPHDLRLLHVRAQRLEIRNHEEAVALVLIGEALLQDADVLTQVKRTARPDS